MIESTAICRPGITKGIDRNTMPFVIRKIHIIVALFLTTRRFFLKLTANLDLGANWVSNLRNFSIVCLIEPLFLEKDKN